MGGGVECRLELNEIVRDVDDACERWPGTNEFPDCGDDDKMDFDGEFASCCFCCCAAFARVNGIDGVPGAEMVGMGDGISLTMRP